MNQSYDLDIRWFDRKRCGYGGLNKICVCKATASAEIWPEADSHAINDNQ